MFLDSDDNSSIQSSPWQRDHCWKQSQPRQNISKELSLYYYRPQVLHLSKECVKVAQQKRRRPLDKNGSVKFNKLPDKVESSDNEKEDKPDIKKEEEQIGEDKLKNGNGDEKTDSEKNGTEKDVVKDVQCKDEMDVKPIITNGLKTPDKKPESKDQVDCHNGEIKKKPDSQKKLDGILKKLCEKMAKKLTTTTTTNGNTNTSHATTTTVIPSTYSLANHIATNIQQHHQHVSPRKRILRELEKVSLEDTKRSRPKHSATTNNINNNNNNNHLNNINNNNHSNFVSTVTPAVNIVNGTSNGIANNKPSVVTRPFSSYSITSLLGHNSNNNNNNNNNNTGCNSINDNHNESSSSSTSHYNQHQPHQQQQHFKESDSAPQRISLSPQSPPPPTQLQQNHHSAKMQQSKRKSPIYTTNTTPPMGVNNSDYVTTTPPSRSYGVRSPDLSPSPEHHAFQKYRPTTTPSTTNSSSPYSYHSPNYMRGSPSPHERGTVVTGGESYNNRLRTTGNYIQSMSPQHRSFVANNHSPSHYSRQSSPNYGTGAGNLHHRDSSLSPNVTENRTTPTNNNSNNINNNNGGSSGGSGSSAGNSIRTVPKKTPALRQQFSSPTMDHPVKLNKSVSKGPTSMEVDSNALIRPSALIPPSLHPPPPSHPASMYYMYPPISYLPPSVAPYYHSFYNPAMNAYPMRYPMHPGAIPGYPPSLSPVSSAQMATSQGNSPSTQSSPNNSQRNAMILSSSPTASNHPLHHHSPYTPTNPWNPISLTTHSINDGNLIQNVKDKLSLGK